MPKATQKTKGRPKKTLADKRDRRPQKIAKAAHKAGDESSDEGEIPPEVRVNLPSIKDIRAVLKDPKDVNLPVDILLLTAKNYEFIACYMQLKNPFKCWFDDVGYVYFGEMGDGDGEKLKVTLLRCHRGSVSPGSSLITVKNAVSVLGPKAVISLGTCSGLNPETTKLGDVIVSAKLTTYASKIVASCGEQSTGMRSYVSRNFLNLIKCADHGWKAPLKNPEALDINVHCDGEFLSGPELISAERRRDELAKSYPLATAIEMEGEGIFAAAFDDQIEWLVVKGIADFADSTDCRSENWRPFASVMAASVVANILSDPVVFRGWPHKGGKRKSSSESLDQDKKRTKLEDSSAMQFLEWSQNQLREFYSTMCQVKITPWDPDNTVHINDIYIQLTLLQDHRKPDGATKNRVGDISEVFEGDEHHPIRRRIVVYGRPGIGKSTFTQKLAVDWAGGKKEILRKFSLLLVIKLRDVCDIPDLCAMLKTAELLSVDDPMAVNNLYEYVRQNQEKVLLILDGYDEYSGGKSSPVHQIWRGGQLRDCCVMITTRPVKEDELRMPSHAQFELNGFDSREQKKQFARKILPNEGDVEGLLNYLEKQNLEEMAEIPLLLLMLCLLWKEKKHRLPTSRAHIYLQFIQTLLDHMATKDADNVATGKSIDEYQEELYKIGKLAYDALLEDRLHFNFSKCAHGDLFEKLIHVGFFQVSKRSALNREKIVYFLHKSVQEFLAAQFIVEELTVKKNETVTCLSRMDTFKKSRKMAEVLKFACELSLKAAGILFDHLHDVGEKEGLTNYQFTKTPSKDDLSHEQQQFILLCVDCLFFCPASDRTAVYSAFLSCVNHVVLLTGKNTSTAAVEHFFKSVSSFPNYLFFKERRLIEHFPDDVLSIMLDLNAVVLTSSGERKDVQKYADLLVGNSFLKKSGGRNFVDLIDITDEDFHSELLPELISAPVCSSQPPLNNLVNNENNNIDVPLTENHCLSLVRKVNIWVHTVKEAVLLKNVLPLVTAPRKILIIWRRSRSEEEEAFDQLIESAINGINFTDNLYSLKLININIAEKCAAFISDSLQHSPNLRELHLWCIPLHRGVSHLAENLHHVPQLTELELANLQMGEKECAALAASLKYLNKLEKLNIRDNALRHGIIELAKNLNNVPNLTNLDLKNTNMGEDEASALAHALKYVPVLQFLDLDSNPLGRGVRDLVQHLSSVPELVHLHLTGVQMTRTECEELYTAVNESNIPVVTDYDVELKENGARFRGRPESVDDDDDSFPIYMKAKGPVGLRAYRRALEKGQTYDRRTKIVLIGQDRTGKTSLRRYLRGEAFDEDEASTDGIEMISPVKSAGEGAWRNPAALENTSALDHKCAEEITKEILSNSKKRSDRAQPLTEVGNKTRGEPTIAKKATEERASHHLVGDPLLIPPSSEHSVYNPRRKSVTSKEDIEINDLDPHHPEEVTPSIDTKDVKIEKNPDEIPKGVLSIIKRGPEHSEGIWPVVWDFAGQAVYHAIHPIFLSPEAVYVLVSDLTKELCAPAQCRIRPHNRDEIEVNSPQIDDTNLDHMMRWLDLVHSLGRPESQKISGNDGDVLPPVVLVGTHADGVSDPCKEMESVKGTICSVALQATLNHISKESFFIDNTNPNREDAPQIVSLRVKILDLAKRMPHINKVIPMQWLRVEQKVDEMVSRDKPIYYVGKKSFKEDIAGGICQFDDPNDVEELLYFLQARGSVIYQDLPENPDGLVVLDPQWLIKVLYEIVTVSPEWKNDPFFQKDFKVLGKKGLLSQKLLDRAFKYLGLEDIKNSLIRIMESFDVICNSENCKGEKYPFFVPCMLESPKKNTRATNMCNGPLPVFLTFNSNYVPSGLFCRLVVHFWKWASRLCGTRIPPSLFANAARFNVSKEYQLTVECHKTVIQLIIWTSRDSDVKEEKRICEELLSHLEHCRTKLSVTCPWLRSVTMKLFVKCQLCEPCPDKCREGTSICMLHKKEGCSHFDCGDYILLRSFGLSCEHSVDAVPDYPAEKLAPWVQALESIERKKQISGSTEHLVRTSLKRRNEEPSSCEAPACKERKTASQGLRFKAGEPSKDELEALSRKLGNKWENLARRLGFDSDGEIDAFKEEKGLANKAFSMLKEWNQKEGSKGTYVVLGKALCHKFVGCTKLAEEFCCDKIEGNGSH